MTTCYEYIRKQTDQDKKMFNRLDGYFKALEDNKLVEYHNQHNRKEKCIDEY